MGGNPGTRTEICRERFSKFDFERSGRLNWTEAQIFFQAISEEMLLPQIDGDEFMRFYSEADADCSGSVTFDECERALASLCVAALVHRQKPTGNAYKALQLQKRFPDVSLEILEDTVEECNGHAGHATKLLRKEGFCDSLQPPPIYGKKKIVFA